MNPKRQYRLLLLLLRSCLILQELEHHAEVLGAQPVRAQQLEDLMRQSAQQQRCLCGGGSVQRQSQILSMYKHKRRVMTL